MIDPFFMTFLDQTHLQLYETALRFTREEIAPYAYAWEEAESFPRELYRKAAEAGLLGAAMPVEYGGGGGDVFHLMMFCEAGMTAGTTGVLAGLGSLEIALPPILFLGSEEQKRRLIPPVLQGEKIAALGVTEPDVGSNVAGVKTTARREGQDYILNGSKMYITSGARADLVTVLARTSPDPHQGLTFFVVERGMPGFFVSGELKKMGWRASDTAILTFEDCRIPEENRLGEEGTGFYALMQNFQHERLMLAVYGHASAQVALQEAERYAKERSAFDRPLIGFQVTRHKLARMATLLRASKALNYQVAAAMKRDEEVLEAVSQAKNFAAEMAMEVCNEAVQIFGGMGYMRESIVERLWRDIRLLPIGGGTTEIMNEIIARVRGYGR